MIHRLSISFLLLVTFAFSCELYEQDEYKERIVVESYLVADRDLPDILVSTTLPIEEEYSFSRAAISDAQVSVRLLSADGESVELTTSYQMDNPGIYQPSQSHTVLPRRTYQLEVQIPGRELVSATTTVPDTFRVLGIIPDTLTYQSREQLELTLTANPNPGRQNVYVFTTIADVPEYGNLTPFYKSIIDDNDDQIPADFANNPSNLINEGNFDLHPDGSITLRYPWLGLAFFGGNRIVANSLDSNLFDFFRSRDVQLGGSTLPPGEIPNVIYHINGGIGVFGSVSADTVETYIQRPTF